MDHNNSSNTDRGNYSVTDRSFDDTRKNSQEHSFGGVIKDNDNFHLSYKDDYAATEVENDKMMTSFENDHIKTNKWVVARKPGFLWYKAGYFKIGKGFGFFSSVGNVLSWIGIMGIMQLLVKDYNSPYLFWPTVLSMIILLGFLIKLSFVDPGFILNRKMEGEAYDRAINNSELYCTNCLTTHQEKTIHGQECDCCIVNLDHHGNVFGNGITSKNLWAFNWIIFIFVITMSLLYANLGVYVYTLYNNQKVDVVTTASQNPQN